MRAKHTLAAVAIAMALIIVSGFVAYTYGESTRKSDTAVATLVSQKTTAAVAATNAERDIIQAKAVKTSKKTQFVKDNKRWKARLKKAVKTSYLKGYDKGNTVGYQAGNVAGYSSGHSAGVDDGIEEGSDELVCSDDKDVNLPSCSSFWDF